MQNLQETQDKLFQEVKALLEQISGSSSVEDFIFHSDNFKNLSEKVVALKIYQEINQSLNQEEKAEDFTEKPSINFEIDTKPIEVLEAKNEEEIILEKTEISEEIDEEYFVEKNEVQEQILEISKVEAIQEFSEMSEIKTQIEDKEEEERLHEERRKIIDISVSHQIKEENSVEELKPKVTENEEVHHERKFKLAHIKGLKSAVQSLFDDDPLEHIHEEPKVETPPKNPSLQKNNMPTDYLEAEKQLPDFKLDINDRLAFSKMLFDNSQSELNEVVKKLNSFKTLDEAKAYLSDVYYERNWEKVDEYAQRLWSLVENKFH